MPNSNSSDPSVSLTKDSRNRYVVQDIKNTAKKQADINLVNKSEKGSDDAYHTLDFVKVNIKK
jgi:hypothetical protein